MLSLGALASLPMMPAYSISKAAAFSLTQSLRAMLAPRGIRVHAVLTGPVDTDMTRGLEVPKATPDSVARAIFDGVAAGEEEIFPDPMSASFAPGWAAGAVKMLERGNAALLGAGRLTMTGNKDLTIDFTVDRTPDEVFAAITNVRGWWSGEIEGPTDELGAEFTYRYEDVHRSTQRITELVPGRRVAWHVVDGYLNFVDDPTEWTGTDITFDIAATADGTQVRFTHVGLGPRSGRASRVARARGAITSGTSLRGLIGLSRRRTTSGPGTSRPGRAATRHHCPGTMLTSG